MAQQTQSKFNALIISVAVLLFGVGAFAILDANKTTDNVSTVTNSQNQTTQISYSGEAGVDALSMLKRNATVQVKHYSFGDLVTSINGTAGTGPKYWTFYINGREATVGAGSYTTQDGDQLMWKLQAGD